MQTILLNQNSYPMPLTPEDLKALGATVAQLHPELLKRALLYSCSAIVDGEPDYSASMTGEETSCLLHIAYELLGCPEFSADGVVSKSFSDDQVDLLLSLFEPLRVEHGQQGHVAILRAAKTAGAKVQFLILQRSAPSESRKDSYLKQRTDLLFSLFNSGALRATDASARQALLDSFSFLPSRYLSASGDFIELGSEQVGAIDKFPGLLSTSAKRLLRDGNRIIPGAMIRNGVHVGKGNIFMFHSAVNIAAFIGDENLIDSHASIGSAAQIGHRNKLGSFVSLEGVLSPANAVPVIIGNDNFFGSFVRIGTGIQIGERNFLGSGVNISLGTKVRDCRNGSATRGEYLTIRDLNENFNELAILPNNATRTYNEVSLVPGEYLVIQNTDEFKSRFEGDARIKDKR